MTPSEVPTDHRRRWVMRDQPQGLENVCVATVHNHGRETGRRCWGSLSRTSEVCHEGFFLRGLVPFLNILE